MKRLIYVLALVFVTIQFAYSQQKENRSLPSFTSISVGEAIDVELIKGSSEQAVVSVSGADLEDVLTEVSGDRLKIRMAGSGNYRNVDVNVVVTFVEISDIRVSSAADLYSQDIIKNERLEISVSSAGDAELEIDVEELEVKVSSAGDLRVSGRAGKQYVDVSSSGDYYAYDLISGIANIDASSSGDAKVNVTERLDADASSAGTVYYRGNPGKVFADSNSGGKVRKD